MKKQKVNLSQINQMKQQFQNLASEKDLVTMRANGRSYQFNNDGTVIVVEGLKQVDFIRGVFLKDLTSLTSRVRKHLFFKDNCLNSCIDDTCFMCKYFIHLDPDTDVCQITDNEVYFDSPKCEDFEICMGEDNA